MHWESIAAISSSPAATAETTPEDAGNKTTSQLIANGRITEAHNFK